MNLILLEASTSDAGSGAASMIMMILYFVIIGGALYFFMIRPQKKRDKEHAATVNAVEVGDSILTTSGFYGRIIGIPDEETVIVEFGNNKNCRIPMQKNAIVEVEKANEE